MITSKLAEDIWGVNVTNTLRQYGNKKVTDAQGQEVKVVGMKNAVIKLGTHLTATYPVVVYQAEHKEMLLGWSFLSDFKLAVYTGCGIGSQPEVAMVKRLNFADEQMECFTKKEEYVPPQAVKVITARIKMPATWSAQDRIQMVGSSIVTHSEDIEGTPINCITVPYSYDIIRINDDVQVIVDNSQNLEPLHIERGQLIAHAELIIEQVENEQILRILDDAASITSEKSMGEIEKQDETQPGRYDYIDKINIKSEEPGTEEFCHQLLQDTEKFWSKHNFDVGKFKRPARITMKTTKPIRDRYKPVNPRVEKEAEEILEQLEKYQLISRANSPYSSNPLWIKKKSPEKSGKSAIAGQLDETKDKKLRLVLNYKSINKHISSDCHYPNPSIKEIMYKMQGAKYVSMLDLSHGYWNIELTPSSKPIVAFSTLNATFVWNRLPQGLSVSMAIMAEAINQTIHEAGISAFTLCYVDNIIVISKSLEEHKIHLRKAIDAFIANGWKGRPSKSHLMINSSCRIFGFHLDLQAGTIGPDPSKVEKIKQMPPPHNHKTARSLAGSINYYNELLPNLGPLMIPIHESTRKGAYKWTEECQ